MKKKHGLVFGFAVLLMIIAAIFAFSLAGCSSGGGDGDGDYALGDTGPGGGIIFYVSEEGFTVYTSATDTTGTRCHYLEAAPEDISETKTWAAGGHGGTNITGTETAIGAGRKNTALILATDTDAPAAKACDEYSNNGKNDWFLPSRDELDKLYENRASVGGFTTSTYYCSSSQASIDGAWTQSFSDGAQADYAKIHAYFARAARAF